MGVVAAAIGDLVVTFTSVFCSSIFALLTALTVTTFRLQGVAWAPLVITTVLMFVYVLVFNSIDEALGRDSYNPTGNASIYAAGRLDGDSPITMVRRFPAQAAGAVAGALAIIEATPVQYRDMVGEPSLKVDVHTGAFAEGLLTFLTIFACLFIIVKGPRNAILQA